jgi:hypothetical protein
MAKPETSDDADVMAAGILGEFGQVLLHGLCEVYCVSLRFNTGLFTHKSPISFTVHVEMSLTSRSRCSDVESERMQHVWSGGRDECIDAEPGYESPGARIVSCHAPPSVGFLATRKD